MVKRISRSLVLLLGCIGLLASCSGPREKQGGLAVGETAPALEAEGWINGDAPTAADLAGKVLVVDAWAFWCGPCAEEAPHLVKAFDTYKDRGVVFVGLTPEDSKSLDKSRQFVENLGITWLNGYGAEATLDKFQTSGYPSVWVIGVDGKVVWNFDSRGNIEDGIEKALAAARK